MIEKAPLRISVFGLGYVGAVTSACLARDSHHVIGVDVDAGKVEMIRNGRAPVVEPGLPDLLQRGVREGRLECTQDAVHAVRASDVSVVSVGTPSQPSGATDLSQVLRVCNGIASGILEKGAEHVVVLRSTVPPGTLEQLQETFARAGIPPSVHLAFNPEFLREGSAIKDYDDPPYTVIGTRSPVAERVLRTMYAGLSAPVHVVEPGIAEMVKFVANAWHAAKVTFANEVGRIANACRLDGTEVMDLIMADTKLNVSPAYMRPGGAYGGSCLPKDTRALIALAKDRSVSIPLLESIPESNRVHVELAAAEVIRTGIRELAIFGLAFKPGTDDLRESPAVDLVKRLLGEGCRLKIYDREVHRARLVGTNLAYIRSHIPHFESLLVKKPEEAVRDANLIVVTQESSQLLDAAWVLADGRRVLDLSRALIAAAESSE